MKTLSVVVFVLLIASVAYAAPTTPDSKPTSAVCKADLKTWSAQKTETLTIKEINERMNEMYTRAEQAKKHEKMALLYLNEFYRTHSELADRAFDFIKRHDLQEQFGEEENGMVVEAKSEPKD